MDRKKVVLLIAASIVAIGTAFMARSLLTGSAAPVAEAAVVPLAEPVPQGPKVLVAQRALTPGTIITADSLSFQPWPGELVKDAYFLEGEADMNKLLGTVVRFAITAGEPVTQGALVAPGDRGFLAAALSPGMRAVTVPVNDLSGVAGFVFPGDRVDMMLTQSVEGDGGELKATETILRNLRVLATDQATSQEVVEGRVQVRKSTTVTLEVTPRIAEKVAVARNLGTLELSLRSLAENQNDLERALASGAIKVPDDATPEEEERILRRAASRPMDGRTSFVTGGDVSRFQTARLPGTDKAAPQPPTVTINRGGSQEVHVIGGGGGPVAAPRSGIPMAPGGPVPTTLVSGGQVASAGNASRPNGIVQ
ncbi:Flp pilus assembly protein CpaB [Qipengyuania sp.]|uniref:Flp pilus assembly protein CpaB n=1 Tax=Qipengyuania sp. TaxID=2004515 RepID=UPI0035C8698A